MSARLTRTSTLKRPFLGRVRSLIAFFRPLPRTTLTCLPLIFTRARVALTPRGIRSRTRNLRGVRQRRADTSEIAFDALTLGSRFLLAFFAGAWVGGATEGGAGVAGAAGGGDGGGGGGGGGGGANVAVTLRGPLIVRTQAPTPSQSPPQPMNVDPPAGVGVSVTTLSAG